MTRNPDSLEALLRAAGPRATPNADRARRVEAAVRLEWQDAVQQRIGRRRAAWIAASCLTSAALIALMLHAHVGQAAPQVAVGPTPLPRPAYVSRAAAPRDIGSYFRANNEDRPPDRGLPRHVLASYSRETR
jgi:hypothetical protein